MKKVLITALFSGLLIFPAAPAAAEDIESIFTKVNEFIAAENFPKALEELNWARSEIEKRHLAKLQTFLPDTIAGFTGGRAEAQSAIGITSVERRYSKDGQNVTLTLSSGAGGGAAAGLAALGQMAGLMGNQPGVNTFRIEGRTANLEVRNGRAELTVFLESGSFLKFQQPRGAEEGEILRTMAEEIKDDIVALDNYLKGTQS